MTGVSYHGFSLTEVFSQIWQCNARFSYAVPRQPLGSSPLLSSQLFHRQFQLCHYLFCNLQQSRQPNMARVGGDKHDKSECLGKNIRQTPSACFSFTHHLPCLSFQLIVSPSKPFFWLAENGSSNTCCVSVMSPCLRTLPRSHPKDRNVPSASDLRGPYPRLGIFTAADANREK